MKIREIILLAVIPVVLAGCEVLSSQRNLKLQELEETKSKVNSSSVYSYTYSYSYSSTASSAFPRLSLPTNVHAVTVTNNSVILAWSSVPSAYFYYVYRSASITGYFSYIASVYGTQYTNSGLNSETSYYYAVTTVDSNYLESYWSTNNAVCITTSTLFRPAYPTNVYTVAVTNDRIILGWTPVPEAYYYKVYRSGSIFGSFSYLTYVYGTQYTNNGLSPEMSYYYIVTTMDSNYQESSWSTNIYAHATTTSTNSIVWSVIATNISSPNYPLNYTNNYTNLWFFTVPGAAKIRVHFADFDTESGYDKVLVLDSQSNTIQTNTGTLGSFYSKTVNGNNMILLFYTDGSITRKGFLIDEIDCSY